MFNKLLLSTLGCALLTSSAASATSASFTNRADISSDVQKKLTMQGNGFTNVRMDRRAAGNKAVTKSPADVITPVILNAEGVEKVYSKSCGGFYLYYGSQLGQYSADDMNATITFGYHNDVYFKNIISTVTTNSYVKGTVSGNTITVQLPQTVMWFDDDEQYGSYGINIGIMDYYVDPSTGEFLYFHDQQKTSVTFTIADDGVIEMEDLGDQMMLGLSYTDDGSFCGYSDTYQMYYPSDKGINTVPDDVALDPYTFIAGQYGYPINVGYDDASKVYIQGIVENMPTGVVVGTVEGNKIRIAQNQNVGIYSAYLLKTMCGYENPNYDPTDEYSTEEPYSFTEGDFILDFDPENKTMKVADSDLFLLLCAELSDEFMYPVIALGNFSIAPHKTFAGKPAYPAELAFYDIYEMAGYNAILFDAPYVGVDGNLLDKNGLAFRVFVNGVLYKFKNAGMAYQGIPDGEIWTEIPYNFSNDRDLYKWGYNEREVDIYFEGMTSMGVQIVYTYNGETTYSDILTVDCATNELTVEGSGVETFEAEDLAGVEFFNINGQRVANPEKGIFVKRSVSTNGAVKVEKIVK